VEDVEADDDLVASVASHVLHGAHARSVVAAGLVEQAFAGMDVAQLRRPRWCDPVRVSTGAGPEDGDPVLVQRLTRDLGEAGQDHDECSKCAETDHGSEPPVPNIARRPCDDKEGP